ncbi:LacI family DNA-binding transcriptional regulator [Paenibacillus tengchongensis]|uniref:LacI family DNA-binding transcriptional regulator n=1 Tax=Paenibacillus tengchongensis TaxID=2608684 RepID=UPI001FE69049|nr:LacI family DNA-binding transcriptional regulator [Paenibacillus tengchongensis]
MTIQHIADQLGLSVSTVSRALNGSYGVHPKTVARVRATADALGYVPNLGAKQLVTRRSNLVGIFIADMPTEVVRGSDYILPSLSRVLQEQQKESLLFSLPLGGYKPGSLSEWVRMRSLEGCVFMAPFAKDHPMIREAMELQVPSVNMGAAEGPYMALAASHNREGGEMAGTHLLEMGHRRIGYINGPAHLHICNERYGGFCDAYRAGTGTEFPERQAVNGDFSGASGGRAVLELLAQFPGLSAVCCANDLMAMGAIMELARSGIRVPQDISVLGFDGAFFTAYTNPPLSTIRHPYEEIGTTAAGLLMELLNGRPAGRELLSPQLIVRDTVRRLV